MRELPSARGILLIFDEVVTGFGRTGHWFAAQHFGIEPDLIVTVKAISSGYVPCGAVLMTEEIGLDRARETGALLLELLSGLLELPSSGRSVAWA